MPFITRAKRHGSQDDSLCLLQEFCMRLESQDESEVQISLPFFNFITVQSYSLVKCRGYSLLFP